LTNGPPGIWALDVKGSPVTKGKRKGRTKSQKGKKGEGKKPVKKRRVNNYGDYCWGGDGIVRWAKKERSGLGKKTEQRVEQGGAVSPHLVDVQKKRGERGLNVYGVQKEKMT